MKRIFIAGVLLLALVSINACDNEDGLEMPGQEDSVLVTSEHDSLVEDLMSLKEGEMRVFTLPAPLQVSTALLSMNTGFKSELIVSKDYNNVYPTQRLNAQNLGATALDLGYSCAHNSMEDCINLLNRTTVFVNELGIENSFNADMIVRFNNNAENNDSISRLILEGYENAHHYFRENGNEELGLFIMSGALVEGIYISSQYDELVTTPQYYVLMGQQKVYLENCIILLSRFGKGEQAAHVIDQLTEIFIMFHSIEPVEDGFENIRDVRIPGNFPESIRKIREAAEHVRGEILEGKC